jgi:hypothetical protein
VDDTFVVWPHGEEELREFLDHHNIKFTIEVEKSRAAKALRPDMTYCTADTKATPPSVQGVGVGFLDLYGFRFSTTL